MKRIACLLLCLLAGGCSSTGLVATENTASGPSDHPLYSYSQLQYLSCDATSYYPADQKASSAFAPDARLREVATRSFLYALLSNNVYRTPDSRPVFEIEGLSEPVRKESSSGLALEIYRNFRDGTLAEIIVVFKGTDFSSLRDWANNLSIYFEPDQYREARELMESLVAEAAPVKAKIIATGHSLGGGIALNMSYLFDGVDAVAFNTSPRAFYAAVNGLDNERLLVAESGEVLEGARWFWRPKFRELDAATFNFMRFNWLGKAVNEHTMYLLARGLLLYAVGAGDPMAARVFASNVIQGDYASRLPLTADRAHDIAACERLLSVAI